VTGPGYTGDYLTTTDRAGLHALITSEALDWIPVPVRDAQPGDVALFRMQGQVCHAGLVLVAPFFLHCQKGIGSAVEKWDAPLWRRRLDSIVRHRALAGRFA